MDQGASINTKINERQAYATLRRYAKEDRRLSWFHFWVILALLLLSYLLLFLSQNIFVVTAASLFLSLLLVRAFVIYHDYVHKTILQHSLIARVVFTCFGIYILAPVSIWRGSHNHHHQHNSKLNIAGIGSFPIMTIHEFYRCSRIHRFAYLLARHPITILFGYASIFIYGMCLKSLTRNFRKHWDSLIALIVHAGSGYLIFRFGHLQLFILAFMLPAMISSCIGSYLFYAQHNYPGVIHHQEKEWSHYNASIRSSSFIGMNWLMEWFTGNIGYHHIHHLNAAVPFYSLSNAHQALPMLKIKSDITLLPYDILSCLQLRVWDPDSNRMLNAKELKAWGYFKTFEGRGLKSVRPT